ncbi:hypothetical protein EDD86DRAFT_273335 [Gorgonomyces haynaldii]|nr:hypothetical protein EDD86DRAFT_278924 [Gorgonomyces haynaldii]KAI8914239.1 hypothetical protein EDD86DRAFT_273335 [Gorgonomyces haynaldii]
MSQPDEIIQKLLESRQKMTDVDAEAEQERQRRMYQMLRYSNHYKKLQVERANLQWDAKQVFDDDLEKALAGLECNDRNVYQAKAETSLVDGENELRPVHEDLIGIKARLDLMLKTGCQNRRSASDSKRLGEIDNMRVDGNLPWVHKPFSLFLHLIDHLQTFKNTVSSTLTLNNLTLISRRVFQPFHLFLTQTPTSVIPVKHPRHAVILSDSDGSSDSQVDESGRINDTTQSPSAMQHLTASHSQSLVAEGQDPLFSDSGVSDENVSEDRSDAIEERQEAVSEQLSLDRDEQRANNQLPRYPKVCTIKVYSQAQRTL